MRFERVGGEEVWSGRIATVFVDRFRYGDGEEAEREIVRHPGAVAVVAHDGEQLYLVAQPREAVDEHALLELPAGKLDEEGEKPLDTAQRELAEEIRKTASEWRELTSFWASPGFSDERIHVFLATGLRDADEIHDPEENERIEIVRWPLERLDELIDECEDSKSLVGLLWLRRLCQAG
jgi:ADP-ribose pyrophosphatase